VFFLKRILNLRSSLAFRGNFDLEHAKKADNFIISNYN